MPSAATSPRIAVGVLVTSFWQARPLERPAPKATSRVNAATGAPTLTGTSNAAPTVLLCVERARACAPSQRHRDDPTEHMAMRRTHVAVGWSAAPARAALFEDPLQRRLVLLPAARRLGATRSSRRPASCAEYQDTFKL
eukprot:360783-Chlamydomonas_euryale.AAC.4